jgi:hypothetical protein
VARRSAASSSAHAQGAQRPLSHAAGSPHAPRAPSHEDAPSCSSAVSTHPSAEGASGHATAPGSATLNISDAGVQFARIDGWSDSPMDTKLDPRKAKTTSELASEIADDLYGEGVRKVGTLSILISLRRAYPHPDDPNPPLCPVCGVLRPAVQVMVSQPGMGRGETSERAFMAPGLVREYDLVAPADAERPAR